MGSNPTPGTLTDRFGVEWRPIVNGQAEIAGVSDELLGVFSKRSADIDVALTEKLDEFRLREGREPSPVGASSAGPVKHRLTHGPAVRSRRRRSDDTVAHRSSRGRMERRPARQSHPPGGAPSEVQTDGLTGADIRRRRVRYTFVVGPASMGRAGGRGPRPWAYDACHWCRLLVGTDGGLRFWIPTCLMTLQSCTARSVVLTLERCVGARLSVVVPVRVESDRR